jgi:hypothetical protein
MDIEEVWKSGVGHRHGNPASDLDRAYEDRPLPIIKQCKEGGMLIAPVGKTVCFGMHILATKRKAELEAGL